MCEYCAIVKGQFTKTCCNNFLGESEREISTAGI